MEFSDISQHTCENKNPGRADIYENTAFSVAIEETGKNEEMYDQLNLSTVTSERRKDVDKEHTSSPNRTNILVYLILVMLVLLYIAVTVLIVIIALPKKNQEHEESRDDRICLPGACSDGLWSSWSSWGTCSESCGGGIRSQTRTCTNPKPTLLGKSCDGTPIQVSICNKQTCPEHKVAFTAYGISGTTTAIFSEVIQNYGNGYRNTTGMFHCTIPGFYYFAVHLSKIHDDNNFQTDLVSCYIYMNSTPQLGAIHDPHEDSDFDNDNSGYSLSLSGTFHLNTNDTVYIGGCNGLNAIYTNNRASFTGFLITPDN